MKRIAYSFLLIALLCPAYGFAQGKIMYGVTAGVNLGSIIDNYIPGRSIGILAGLEIGYFNWDHYSVSIQALYDQKGHTVYNSAPLLMNYLEVPITVKIPFTFSYSKFYFFAGPTIGFFLSSSSGEDAPLLDYGLYSGLGFTTPLNKDLDFVFEAGATLGFNNISHHPVFTGIITYTNDHSQDIRIQLGILFGKEVIK